MATKRPTSLPSDILSEICCRYGLQVPDLSVVKGGLANLMYEYWKDDKFYMLRVSSEKPRDQILAELDWIRYLRDNGVSASKPVPSNQDKLVETVSYRDRLLHCVSFEKAAGQSVLLESAGFNPVLWNDTLWRGMGRLMGRMHSLTKDYSVEGKGFRRKTFDDDPFIQIRDFVSKPLVIEKFNDLLDDIRSLSRSRDGYGLVHGDFIVWNFFVHRDQIILFDFDDARYDWFINDIAVTFHNTLINAPKPAVISFAERFIRAFWQGYKEENTLNVDWIRLLPAFLQFQTIYHYTVFNRMIRDDLLDEEDKKFFRGIISSLEKMIVNNIPFVEFTVKRWCQLYSQHY
ncbi:MAG: phosphotransferase enzyme family protein [Candidatus Odinarchaeota archaeon]